MEVKSTTLINQTLINSIARERKKAMNEVISDNIHNFLEFSNKLNSKTVSLTRFQILTLLSYFKDGIQYRELKTALGISDGKLISNLKSLKAMGYIHNFEVEIDHRKLDVYALTEKGQEEIEKVTAWTQLLKDVIQSIGGKIVE